MLNEFTFEEEVEFLVIKRDNSDFLLLLGISCNKICTVTVVIKIFGLNLMPERVALCFSHKKWLINHITDHTWSLIQKLNMIKFISPYELQTFYANGQQRGPAVPFVGLWIDTWFPHLLMNAWKTMQVVNWRANALAWKWQILLLITDQWQGLVKCPFLVHMCTWEHSLSISPERRGR